MWLWAIKKMVLTISLPMLHLVWLYPNTNICQWVSINLLKIKFSKLTKKIKNHPRKKSPSKHFSSKSISRSEIEKEVSGLGNSKALQDPDIPTNIAKLLIYFLKSCFFILKYIWCTRNIRELSWMLHNVSFCSFL